jgi:vacuolar-type H+-ATPase subunit I/STV1
MRTFLQVLTLSFTLGSAFFMVKASLGLSARDIAGLVGTYIGFNPHLIHSLTAQVTDYRVGTILLVLAFILQMINVLWPIRYIDFAVSRKGALLALIMGLFVFVAAYLVGDQWAAGLERTVLGILGKS